MDIGEDINKVTIEVEIEDKTSQGLQQTEQKVSASAEKIGEAFDKKMGSGAQAATGQVTKLDKSIKNATDSNNLASKSVNKLVRAYNPFNIAIGAAIAGVVALGKHLYDMAVGPITETTDKMAKLNKEFNDFIEGTSKYIDEQLDSMSTLTDNEKKRRDINNEIADAVDRLYEADRRVNEEMSKVSDYIGVDKELLETSLRKKFEYDKWAESIKDAREQLERLNETERLQMGREMGTLPEVKKGKGKGKGGGGGGRPSIIDFGPTREDYEAQSSMEREAAYQYQLAIDERIDGIEMLEAKEKERAQYYIDAERMASEAAIELAEFRYQSIEDIEKKLAASHQQQTKEFVDDVEAVASTVSSLVSIAGKIAEASIKDEKKRMKATAAITAILESIAAAVEVAKAIGAYPNIPEMAAHAASAAAHVVAAVLAAKYGGGGATVPSKTGSAGGGGVFKPEGGNEKTSTTLNVFGHIFSPESGADFVRKAYEASEDQRNPGRTRSEVK